MSGQDRAAYFLGEGALLRHAVDYSLRAGVRVAGICCPAGDSGAAKLGARGMATLESADPNEDLPRWLDARGEAIVFSINNRHLIKDHLLGGRLRYFNIHNGLVQDYRGIGEVCLFAALCAGDVRYGATMQQLLPGDRVDCGPVVAQLEFPVRPEDRFCDLLPRSLESCRNLFEAQLRSILSNRFETHRVETSKSALSYRDVAALGLDADPARLARARDLGRYRGLLPRLASAIESAPAGGRIGHAPVSDARGLRS